MSTSIPNACRLVRAAAQWPEVLAAADTAAPLGDRELGTAITNGRTSWVRRLELAGLKIFVKTYDYASCISRLQGAWRHTGPWRRSRAAREYDALHWLRDHDLPAPCPLAVYESRRVGLLTRAILVTEAFDGTDVATLLPELPACDREAVAAAIGRLVGTLHRLGFRDRNLDLRNLIARRDAEGWVLAKIDSPRFRLRRPGASPDGLTRADWARLLPQLERFGLGAAALAAATG